MTQNVLILGATGQIAQLVTTNLLKNTDYHLTLYGRNLSSRIKVIDPTRETIVNGDFSDFEKLTETLEGIDIVYLNSMSNEIDTQNIITALKVMLSELLELLSLKFITNSDKKEFKFNLYRRRDKICSSNWTIWISVYPFTPCLAL